MSWQIASLILLLAVLGGGFVWYERSRPPSRVVALVAAMAALAIAGRVLDPIPNVAVTTDIALLTGYALGGPPGFAVGALGGLVSNFWLGQGPWTPWQMAGWGLCGIGGAALAAATGRRLGRLGLACFCALAGLLYGALLDFSLMVTYGGEQSLERFLALSARGIPFNLAHAVGNFAIALVAGPALVRMMLRFRQRFEFRWRAPEGGRSSSVVRSGAGAGIALLLVALALAVPQGGERARAAGEPVAHTAGAVSALRWLQRVQNDDGGFAAKPGEDSSVGITGWAVLGLEAAGRNPLDLRYGRNSPVNYLKRQRGEVTSTGDLERTILAWRGAGLDPRHFRGQNLVRRLRARRGQMGSWGGQVNLTAFGVLALKAAGAAKGNKRSAAWLRGAQNADGGWGFVDNAPSDADSTGAVLQALAAVGGSKDAIKRGVAKLRSAQRPSGGWALSGSQVNSQSTAWAIQGLIAAGVRPRDVRTNGNSGFDYLRSMQAPNGHFRYSKSSNQTPVWVTAQALMAVSGDALPLRPVARRAGGPIQGGGSANRSNRGGGSGDDDYGNGGGAGTGSGGSGLGGAFDANPVPSAGSAGSGSGADTGAGVAPPASSRESGQPEAEAEAEAESSDAPPLATEEAGGESGDERASVTLVVATGMLALVAALGYGWLRYRRRLPR